MALAGLLNPAQSAQAALFSVLAGAPPTGRDAEAPLQLAETPLNADLLGFSMRVPVGAAVRIERGEIPGYLIADSGETPRWRLRVSNLRASKPETTPQSQCAEFLAELKAKEPKLAVRLDESRVIGGRPAHVFYVSVPIASGGSGISGTLLVATEPDNYLVFSIVSVEDSFSQVRALLDMAFGTVVFANKGAILEERATLLGRGEAIAASITPDALRATFTAEPLFYRMWKPDEGGAPKEVGYVIIRAREGKRGEIDASKTVQSLKDADALAGLLTTVDARIIVNGDASHTLDVQSRYFVSFERDSESWSIRSTQRHRAATRSTAQTGLREPPTVGAPRPVLRVISASREGMTREPVEWDVPPAYLSQAELVVLGQLLPRNDRVKTIEFLDYAFDQRDEKMPQRRETWSRTPSGWRLETRIGASPDKLVQEFDKDGVRVKRVDPDGTVTERITLEALRALWKSKGLPVE